MHVYQLLLNKEWQELYEDYRHDRGEFRWLPLSPQRIKHFYADDYDDIIKKLMADPSSCKNFYPLLHQLGLPHATYYHRLQGKITKLLKTALYEEKLIVRLLPTPSGCFGGYEGNKAKPVKPIIKKQDYYQPDYSWIGLNLVNHRPELVAFYDGDNLNHYIFTQPTSDEEIFLHSANPFAKTQVLPKVHLLLGGNQADVDLTLRGDKPLRVKTLAQAWLNELTELLASGNSPFTIEHDKALASAINHGFSYQHYRYPHFADKEQVFRPDERIALLFYQLLIVLQHSSFITAQQRIGDLGYGESEGAIVDVHSLKDTLKTLRALRHSEGYDKADYRYHNNQLALIANEYLNSPLVLDGTGQDGDYESKLKQQLQQDVLHDNLSDIQSLYFNAIKLLKHLRQAGIIKHVETRKDYKLKATKLSYTYLELQPNQGFYLHFHQDHKYAITSLSQGHQFIGRFNQQGLADIKIPQKWAAIDDWQLTTSAVEGSFVQEYFNYLKINTSILTESLLNQQTSLTSTLITNIIGYYYGNEIKSTFKKYEHQIIGGAQALGGALTVIAAGAIEVGTLGGGTPFAITLGFIGSDNIAAGISRMLTDKEVNTLGEDIIAWSGMVPKGYEGITYGLIDLTLGSKAVSLTKLPSAVNQVSIRYLATNEAKHSPLQNVELIVDKLSKNTSSKRHVIQYKPNEMVTKKIDSIVKAEQNFVESGTITVKTADGISFRIDQPAHLSTVEKYSQGKGIVGGHNADAFYAAVKQYNIKILTEIPTGTPGITKIEYKIPAKDRAGNFTGHYKGNGSKPLEKTIYDPTVFTDKKILELGQQAAIKGYPKAMASINGQASAIIDGIEFRLYIDKTTGIVRNFHPE